MSVKQVPKQLRSNIKNWSIEDRPREKLRDKGKSALSNAELLAILIGSGSRKETALDLCKRILKELANNNLQELGKKNIADFTSFSGIGEAKAISIIAALELGRRRLATVGLERPKITNSRDAFTILHPHLGDLAHEEFWVLILSRSNKVLKSERISIGGVSGTVADVKIIFKRAIEALASAIILAHNHPSGNLRPSQADKQLTKKMVQAGKYLDVQVLDHLIVTDSGYYSFADEGEMYA